MVIGTLGISSLVLVADHPYSRGWNDPENVHDAPIPGFVGPEGQGVVGGGNYVNPLFATWVDSVVEYHRADQDTSFSKLADVVGPVTGDHFKVVSLGELDQAGLDAGDLPGRITLRLERPLMRLPGADLVVFENAFSYSANSAFIELAYVEVSSDGTHFARFPSHYLGESPMGPWAHQDPRKIFNLAGKHINSYGQSWGTPFDFNDLIDHPLVESGQVDLDRIEYVRIVDIPGSGVFQDSEGNAIYDPWPTFGSGGFDLEAVGGISVAKTFAEWYEERFPDRPVESLPAEVQNQVRQDYWFALPSGYADLKRPSVLKESTGSGGRQVFRWVRDLRHSEGEWQIQVSEDLADWEVILVSADRGREWVWQNDADLTWELTDESLSLIRSVGVLRGYALKLRETSAFPATLFYRIVWQTEE